MDILTLYLITVLDPLNTTLGIFSFIAGFFSVIALIAYVCCKVDLTSDTTNTVDTAEEILKVLPIKALWTAFIILWILSTAIPSTKQAMMIAGGYFATNIEGIENLPPNVMKAANKFIEQYTKEQEVSE